MYVFVAVGETVSESLVLPPVQVFPVGLFETIVTLSPAQILVEPLTVMEAVSGLTVISFPNDDLEPQPLETVTEYVPEVNIFMVSAVDPPVHTLLVVLLDFNTTLSPEQKVVELFAVIVGTGGGAVSTVTFFVAIEVQPPFVNVSV